MRADRSSILDDPSRGHRLASLVKGKPGLRRFYEDCYARYRSCLARATAPGAVLEIGSGGGFAKERIDGLLTSDVLSYPHIDLVLDGRALPFRDASLRAVFMMNVFHHVPDVELLLRELSRCLAPGGRVLLVEQYPGFPSDLVYRYVHHEAYDPKASSWSFASTGPLSGANGALAWIVFFRDVERFRRLYPELHIERREPHSPFAYWLAGGLKSWSMLPGQRWVRAAFGFDRVLSQMTTRFSSFVDIEIRRA